MKRRFTARPAPAQSLVAAVVGVFMLIFALCFFPPMKEAPLPVVMFLTFWVVGVICVILYHIVNATRRKGVPMTIIETADEDTETASAADRLKTLEDLRSRQLISNAEYEAKRQEVLKEL